MYISFVTLSFLLVCNGSQNVSTFELLNHSAFSGCTAFSNKMQPFDCCLVVIESEVEVILDGPDTFVIPMTYTEYSTSVGRKFR